MLFFVGAKSCLRSVFSHSFRLCTELVDFPNGIWKNEQSSPLSLARSRCLEQPYTQQKSLFPIFMEKNEEKTRRNEHTALFTTEYEHARKAFPPTSGELANPVCAHASRPKSAKGV
jgi:hypothetical protein